MTNSDATIGILVPIVYQGFRFLQFQQMATAAILAVHHVNTRDPSIVGDAIDQLPLGFSLKYKISDTHFSTPGSVQAILDWRNQEGYAGFANVCPGAKTNQTWSNTSLGMYGTISSSDKILTIVGSDISEASKAVAVIAGLGGTPLISYYSTATTLSDKKKYPAFSRSVPAQSFNTNGLASIIANFGWFKCAVLYSDSEYGTSFSADFQQYAASQGIKIALLRKFTDNDASSLNEAVLDLRASGARIFVFLAQGAENFAALLAAGDRAGIVGVDGYVWISSEISGANDPEAFIAAAADPPRARRLLAGSLTIAVDALYGDKRRRFEQAYASADPTAVYDPLVRMPAAGFAPPRTPYDAFAYDAVWAAALGAAAARADRSDLLGRIRAARFTGASGTVAFDPATGDRAPEGLQVRDTARGPARARRPAPEVRDSGSLVSEPGVQPTPARLSNRRPTVCAPGPRAGRGRGPRPWAHSPRHRPAGPAQELECIVRFIARRTTQ